MKQKAELVMTQGRQAVCLPKNFRFRGTEVFISRDKNTGDVVLSETNGVSPDVPKTWDEFFDSLPDIDPSEEFDVGERQLTLDRDPVDGTSIK